MNRLLKFRVWDSSINEYLKTDQDNPYLYYKLGVSYNLSDIMFFYAQSKNLKWIVQQYTGLTDSKGNEIYEGDVVKTIYDDDFSVGTVFHHEETGSYRIQSKNQLLPIVTYRFVENKPQGLLLVVHEVIGNIFENNELLTQYEQNK